MLLQEGTRVLVTMLLLIHVIVVGETSNVGRSRLYVAELLEADQGSAHGGNKEAVFVKGAVVAPLLVISRSSLVVVSSTAVLSAIITPALVV